MTVITLTPAEAARYHAASRAWRRYGLAISIPDLRAAEQRIWAGRAHWLEDQVSSYGTPRQAYRSKLKGKLVVMVFDIHIEAIVTVLPWSAIGRMERQRRRARNLKRAGLIA